MLNILTLKRQHQEIGELIKELKQAMTRENLEQEASDMALKISLLAGKLKIHLGTEDRHMYPQLLQSPQAELKSMAGAYMEEMGHISKVFTQYKDRFNTRSKIIGSPQDFFKDTRQVLGLLEERIEKEDKGLYTML